MKNTKNNSLGINKVKTFDSYLLELRMGYAQSKLANNIEHIKDTFHLSKESPPVPHLSLYGSFKIKNGYNFRDVQRKVARVAKKYDKLPFLINGWDTRNSDTASVIAYKIEPSEELKQFRADVVRELLQITVPKNAFDYDLKNPWFHSTLAYQLNPYQFEKISEYLGIAPQQQGFIASLIRFLKGPPKSPRQKKNIRPLYLPVDALRVTLIHNSLIAAEFDLTNKMWLDRWKAKNPGNFGITLHNYRMKQGIELQTPRYYNAPTVFTIGDLHLGHANIIRYCSRPFQFTHVREMDQVLINNWNYTVKPSDYVYYTGDLCCTRDNALSQQMLHALNGNIVFITGNHDENTRIEKKNPFVIYRYRDVDFLFTHYPRSPDIPEGFDGWVIHGHTHNNDLRNHPFFDPKHKRVNVGAELIKYQPIALDNIYRLIKSNSGSIRYLK